ncbi:MAG TPA: hypothetical protein VM468_00400 [Mycoplana sp.]|nr:hypothetical protein [Mycoplana sp.]
MTQGPFGHAFGASLPLASSGPSGDLLPGRGKRQLAKISAKFQNPFRTSPFDGGTLSFIQPEVIAMMTHCHERTAYCGGRDELIELIASGITAYPGSEMGYLIDMLSRDDAEAPPAKAWTTWSWRAMFSLEAVPRLT